jgi:heptosyltransferase-2
MEAKMMPARILVIRGGALGDLLLTFPALKAIRVAWPAASIVLSAYPPQSRLALAGQWVNELVSLDSGGAAEWFGLSGGLSREQFSFLSSFDLAISFLHDPEGYVVGHLREAGIQRIVIGTPQVGKGHAIDHFVEVLAELGVAGIPGEGARLDLPEDCVRDGARRVEALGGDVAAIHPGSGSLRKNWPLERFAQLANAMRTAGPMRPVFVLGDAEGGMGERLAVLAPGIPQLKGLDLVQLAGFLRNCRHYIGNDSGVTHLAAAVGIPVFAIFGATDPGTWAPRGGRVKVVDAAEPAQILEWVIGGAFAVCGVPACLRVLSARPTSGRGRLL